MPNEPPALPDRSGIRRTTSRPFLWCTVLAAVTVFAPSAAAGDAVEGTWQSIGYDLALAIEGDHFALYETTPIGNLKVDQGDLAKLRSLAGTMQLDASEHLETQDPTSIAPIAWKRVENLPEASRLTVDDDARNPLRAFDIVWHTFNNNYAFFELRDLDWQKARDTFRPQLTAESTDAELFEVLAKMLAALEDNHVELNAPGFDFDRHRTLPNVPLVHAWQRQHASSTQDEDLMTFIRGKYGEYVETSAKLIAAQMVDGPHRGADGKLVWGMLPDEIGYLGIRSMAGFVSDDDAPPEQHLGALDKALDRAMDDLAGARAMIVDVRFNGGGWDPAAVRIASRFADRRRPAFTKKARTPDGFTPKHTVYVQPSGPRQHTRPVTLLTSPMTASAAEIFVFCMNALPHVQQAGMPTMGIHSDQLMRHLPGGWSFSLSNEIYATIDGDVYEKVGIPPVAPVPMFSTDDFAGNQDAVVEKARALASHAADKH
ncbi:MAG: hypothetical protein DWQ37_00245 [Planctomycetota bacterium]|nr:MAG: hypothetical protein DWQ37_00245 [Planctomycetota bacterium]